MIKNKFKKIISIAVLTGMIVSTSVNVFAGSSSSKMRQQTSSTSEMCKPSDPQSQVSESDSCGEDVKRTSKLTIIDCLPDILDNTGSLSQISESGSCGENVTYSFNAKTGELTIAGNGEIKNYSDLEASPWSRYKDRIKIINIERGVTTIGDYAFDGCTNSIKVHVGSSVAWIGKNAFRGFTDLTNVYIYNSEAVSLIEDNFEHIGAKFLRLFRVHHFWEFSDSDDTCETCESESDKQISEPSKVSGLDLSDPGSSKSVQPDENKDTSEDLCVLSLSQVWDLETPDSDSFSSSSSCKSPSFDEFFCDYSNDLVAIAHSGEDSSEEDSLIADLRTLLS